MPYLYKLALILVPELQRQALNLGQRVPRQSESLGRS